MIVSDIYEDCKSITNYTSEALNFSRITDAVEVLSNKGNFDALLGYLDITVPDTGRVVLPRDVEVPLKVNIDTNPTIARDRLYEFTLNGPGEGTARAGWQWEDGLRVPIMGDGSVLVDSILSFTCMPSDNGKKVTILGRNPRDGRVQEVVTLNADSDNLTVNRYSELISVHKDITTSQVSIYEASTSTLLSTYQPDEVNCQYRVIKLTPYAGGKHTAHILFRRNRFAITSQNDFIPIRSKMGLILMLKALEAYREERFPEAKGLEEKAIALANEEQDKHNAFVAVALDSERSTALNLNYNNMDTMIVADIYDEACMISGPVGRPKVFDNITEAIAILSNKGQWDSQRGYVDIATDQYQYVTLPRYVDYVIKMNIEGRPTTMKNKWFQFNSGSPGTKWLPHDSWVDVGNVVTYRDMLYPQRLAVVPDLDQDLDVQFRVYGYYQGKKIFSNDLDGVAREGFLVDASADSITGSSQPVDRIERITKSVTNGFVKLLGYDLNDGNRIQLGYYWPDETEPSYRRIKLPQGCDNVHIMYRKRNNKITSLTDPIHLKSKTAVLTMMRAIELLRQGKPQDAEAMEAKAVKLLVEEYQIMNQSEARTIDFGKNFTPSDQFIRC